MRITMILLLTLLVPASVRGETNETAQTLKTAAISPAPDYSPMTPGGKIHFYLQSSVDPISIFASAFSAGYKQAADSVPEWGQGMEGYGKRFASSFGQKAVDRTVRSGMQILLREDPRYFYSDRQGIRPRTFHAIGETFVARKDSGGTRPNYSWLAGMASGVYISHQWHPENDRTAEDYIFSTAVSIGVQSAKNVFTEFWPDIKKKFLRR